MRFLYLGIFVFLFLLSSGVGASYRVGNQGKVALLLKPKHSPASLLIKFKPGQEPIFISAHIVSLRQKFPLSSFQDSKLREAAELAGIDRWYVADIDNDINMAVVIGDAMEHIEVERVEPIYRAQLADMRAGRQLAQDFAITGSDPLFREQWYLENTGQKGGLPGFDIRAVNFGQSIEKLPESKNITIIHQLDSGIDVNHPDVEKFNFRNKGEIPNDGIDNDKNGYIDDYNGYNSIDDNGSLYDAVRHGTAVSSVMGATVDNGIGMKGMLGKLSGRNFFVLMSKFLTFNGGTYEDAGESIIYGYKMGAKVTNHSWTGEYSQFVYDAFKMGEFLGHIHVCAAGNKGFDTDMFAEYPAAFAFDSNHRLYNVIAVASNNRFGFMSKFSAFGSGIQISAPGEDIVCALANSEGYFTASGTSLSSPLVTGAVAVLINNNPDRHYTLIMDDVLRLSRGSNGLELKLQFANTLDISHLLVQDDKQPVSIKNLKYLRGKSTSNSAFIRWDVPRNEAGICSEVYGYEIRYSDRPWDDYYKTSPVRFNPAPSSEDVKRQSWSVYGLNPQTQYFVGIRWRDACGNWSKFNIIETKTK